MDYGLVTFSTADAIAPAALARLAEERGFESLFLTEHTHIPVSRETPYPGGGELPDVYRRTFDPLVALAAAAEATERIRLATGILLIVERDPIATAKALASLDVLSGGRLIVGVGAGWNREEMRNHGTDPDRRFGLMRERVEAMRAIWTQDEASYQGEHVRFDALWSWPKPVQSPHPPVLVGGNGERVLERVRRFGDGWMPNATRSGRDELLARIRSATGEGIPVTVFGCPAEAEAIEAYAEAGAARCVFALATRPAAESERRLDELARLI